LVKFTPFLSVSDYVQIKFECLAAPPWCSFDLRIYTIFFQIYHNFINNFSSRHQGGGADTLKFNLHIIRRAKRRAKKGCEFNQKRCGFKILLYIYRTWFFPELVTSMKPDIRTQLRFIHNYVMTGFQWMDSVQVSAGSLGPRMTMMNMKQQPEDI